MTVTSEFEMTTPLEYIAFIKKGFEENNITIADYELVDIFKEYQHEYFETLRLWVQSQQEQQLEYYPEEEDDFENWTEEVEQYAPTTEDYFKDINDNNNNDKE